MDGNGGPGHPPFRPNHGAMVHIITLWPAQAPQKKRCAAASQDVAPTGLLSRMDTLTVIRVITPEDRAPIQAAPMAMWQRKSKMATDAGHISDPCSDHGSG
jgi:hypothetical protein